MERCKSYVCFEGFRIGALRGTRILTNRAENPGKGECICSFGAEGLDCRDST